MFVSEELGSVTWQPVSMKWHTFAIYIVTILSVTARNSSLGATLLCSYEEETDNREHGFLMVHVHTVKCQNNWRYIEDI